MHLTVARAAGRRQSCESNVSVGDHAGRLSRAFVAVHLALWQSPRERTNDTANYIRSETVSAGPSARYSPSRRAVRAVRALARQRRLRGVTLSRLPDLRPLSLPVADRSRAD